MADPKQTIIELLMQLETPNHRIDQRALLAAMQAWERDVLRRAGVVVKPAASVKGPDHG